MRPYIGRTTDLVGRQPALSRLLPFVAAAVPTVGELTAVAAALGLVAPAIVLIFVLQRRGRLGSPHCSPRSDADGVPAVPACGRDAALRLAAA